MTAGELRWLIAHEPDDTPIILTVPDTKNGYHLDATADVQHATPFGDGGWELSDRSWHEAQRVIRFLSSEERLR